VTDSLPSRRFVPGSLHAVTPAIWASLILLALLLVYPLVVAIVDLVRSGAGAATDVNAAWADGSLVGVMFNTVGVVAASTLFALVVGLALAWVNERTDAGVQILGELLPLAPLLMPPIAGVMGWCVLLDPRVGYVNLLVRDVLTIVGIHLASGPLDIYSAAGLVCMTGLYLVPYCYLIVSAGLRRLDPSLEEASRIAGAGLARTLLRITLPSILPAITAAALLSVIGGLGLFSVPVVIGTGARIDVLSVYIFRLIQDFPPQTGFALVLAAGMVTVVQAVLILQRILVPGARHAAIGGRGLRRSLVMLGSWRVPVRVIACAYLGATAILPLIALIVVSGQSFWTPRVNWRALSLEQYRFVLFENGSTSRALIDSLVLAFAAATTVMLIAGLVMIRTRFASGPARHIANVVTTLPATIPHTVIALAVLLAFSLPPFRLYGSAAILLLAYIVIALPYAGQAANTGAIAIGRELSEASRVCGAGRIRTYWRILFPLALPALVAGWSIVFIHTAGELTASALLSGTANPVVGRMLMDLWNYGSFPQVAALALVMTGINAVLIGIVLRVGRRIAAG
jgi:iron(III) transport system permease protein